MPIRERLKNVQPESGRETVSVMCALLDMLSDSFATCLPSLQRGLRKEEGGKKKTCCGRFDVGGGINPASITDNHRRKKENRCSNVFLLPTDTTTVVFVNIL